MATHSNGFSFGASPKSKWTDQITWFFSCGHRFTQQKELDQIPSPVFNRPVSEPKQSNEQCPECMEAVNKSRRAQEKDLQEAKEQVTKAEKQEAKALSIYKSQIATIEKHIAEAGDDDEVRAELTTMLKNCKLLWADKVKEMVTRSTDSPSMKSQISTNEHKSLADKKEKVELMCERAEILYAQEVARSGKASEKAKELEGICDEWKVLRTKMSHIVKQYETKIVKELGGIEEDVFAAWTRALELIKRS